MTIRVFKIVGLITMFALHIDVFAARERFVLINEIQINEGMARVELFTKTPNKHETLFAREKFSGIVTNKFYQSEDGSFIVFDLNLQEYILNLKYLPDISIQIVSEINGLVLDEWELTGFHSSTIICRQPDASDNLEFLGDESIGYTNNDVQVSNFFFETHSQESNDVLFARTGSNEEIRFGNTLEILEKRRQLIQSLWGMDKLPLGDSTLTLVNSDRIINSYEQLKNPQGNLKNIHHLRVSLPNEFNSDIYLFHPLVSNGRLLIYHSGHNGSGFIWEDIIVNGKGVSPGLVLPEALKQGFTVMGVSMPLYGNVNPTVNIPDYGNITLILHPQIFTHLPSPNPLIYFLEPLCIALNYIDKNYVFEGYYMTGLSGGGWTTTVYSALDTRIKGSYPVAGSIPIPLRTSRDNGDDEQFYEPFYSIANYSELYVMASLGREREQLQVLIKNDPCCFSPYDGSEWVGQVSSTLENYPESMYSFLHDTISTDHCVSPEVLQAIFKQIDTPEILLTQEADILKGTYDSIKLPGSIKWYGDGVFISESKKLQFKPNTEYYFDYYDESGNLVTTSHKFYLEKLTPSISINDSDQLMVDIIPKRIENAELTKQVDILFAGRYKGYLQTNFDGFQMDSLGKYQVRYFDGINVIESEAIWNLPEMLINYDSQKFNCIGDTLTLSSPQISGIIFKWKYDGISVIDSLLNSSLLVSASGGYKLEVWDGNELVISDSVSLDFVPCFGINSINYTFYPNPVAGDIKLDIINESNSSNNITVRLFGIDGKFILKREFQLNVGETSLYLNLEAEKQGLYILEVSDGAISQTHRILKL